MTAGKSRGWILWAVVLSATALALGLIQVRLNIERVDLAYDLKKLQVLHDEKQAHAAKLMVERDNLCSPYRLRKKAKEYGLGPARPGQIRTVREKSE